MSLIPCPFCDGVAMIARSYNNEAFVKCYDCEASTTVFADDCGAVGDGQRASEEVGNDSEPVYPGGDTGKKSEGGGGMRAMKAVKFWVKRRTVGEIVGDVMCGLAMAAVYAAVGVGLVSTAGRWMR